MAFWCLDELPDELVARIACYIDTAADLIAFGLVSRRCHEITQMAALRYQLSLWKHHMIDNVWSDMTAQDKLIELETRQSNWLALKPRTTEDITFMGGTTVYEMQEGLFLWCPREQPHVLPSKLRLLSLPTGNPELRKRVDEQFRDTGVSILDLHLDPTQDLLILSQAMPPNTQQASFSDRGDPVPLNKYVFLTLSTLEPHPEVTKMLLTGPPLFPHNTVVAQLLQIYGDVFAVLTLPSDIFTGQIYNQEINIWNWRSGDQLCSYRLPTSLSQASFALLSATEFMVTLHRPDGDPSAEIYTFVDLPGPSKLPLLMAHFCFLPLQEDVQVDFDLRPDPPFPARKGSGALGKTKPFTDNPEEGLLIFNMTVMTEMADSFTHLVIAASKPAMLTMARQRFQACKAQSHALYHQGTDRENVGDNSQRKFAYLSWELWGSTNTRIFEDNTLSTNWVCFVHGYRFARLARRSQVPVRRPRLGPYQIEVLDFSPISIHTVRQSYGPDGFTSEDGTTQTVVSRISILNNTALFRRTILSSLPFVITTTGRHYMTEGVMIGESSLIITKAEAINNGEIQQTLTVLGM